MAIDKLYLASLRTCVPRGHLDRDQADKPKGRCVSIRYREFIVKYISELCEEFRLRMHTIHLACNYFDRWLSDDCLKKHATQDRIDKSWAVHVRASTRILGTKLSNTDCAEHIVSFFEKPTPTDEEVAQRRVALKRTLQMVSAICILMASKFDDVKLPPLSEISLLYEDANTSPRELANLELEVLGILDWRLHAATPYTFYDPILHLCDGHVPNDLVQQRAHFYMDLSVYDYNMLNYHPAVRTCAALLLAWERSPEPALCNKYIEDMCTACHTTKKQIRDCIDKMKDYERSAFRTGPG